MEFLKEKLFDVLANSITIEEFENWLYSNEEVNASLNDNEMLFEIISINYKSKHAFHELKKYCHVYFDYDEYLVSLVESSCRKLVRAQTSVEVWPVIMHLGSYMDWEKDYGLINQFYYFQDDLSLVEEGYYKEKDVIKHLNQMAQVVLKELENLALDAKIEKLKTGIIIDLGKDEHKENTPVGLEKDSKKWYQFWK